MSSHSQGKFCYFNNEKAMFLDIVLFAAVSYFQQFENDHRFPRQLPRDARHSKGNDLEKKKALKLDGEGCFLQINIVERRKSE